MTVPVVLTLIDNAKLSQQYKQGLEEALSGSERRNRILLELDH